MNNILFLNLLMSIVLIVISPFIILTSIIIASQLSDNDNNPVDTSPGSTQQSSSLTLMDDGSHTTTVQILAVGGFGIVLNVIYFVFSFNLYKFFDEVSKGNAFEFKNVTRLRIIAISIILTSLMFVLFNNIFTKVFEGLSKDLPDLNTTCVMIILGFVVWAISEAFKQGYDLKKEQSLTI